MERIAMPQSSPRHVVIAFVLFIAAVTLCYAQSPPPLLNYQGRLVDAEGIPLNGPRTLAFRIYDGPVDANLIWGPQTFVDAPVVDGYYNVILGNEDLEAGGDSVTTAFLGEGSDPRFFSVTIDGSEPFARQQVLSSAYTIRTMHADEADVIIVDTDSILDRAVTEPKLADDVVTSRSLAINSVYQGAILDSAVTTATLADGSVTNTKLAALNYAIATTPAGTITFATTNNSVPGLAITMQLSGKQRPVLVQFFKNGRGDGATDLANFVCEITSGGPNLGLELQADGVSVSKWVFAAGNGAIGDPFFPVESISFLFIPETDKSSVDLNLRLVNPYGTGGTLSFPPETIMFAREL